mgnify:FL=1
MKRWLRTTLGVICLLLLVVTISFQLIFKISELPEMMIQKSGGMTAIKQCFNSTNAQALDTDKKLNVLVWNIYKQNRTSWKGALNSFSEESQLLLLQEASLTESFKQWISIKNWKSHYVSAFSALDVSSGVVNLSSQLPVKACAFTQAEPWLRLPKSALYARYRLSDGQELAVINIHAINFTLGVTEYVAQIEALKRAAITHSGPMILAGDFNSWSEERTQKLAEIVAQLRLKEVIFTPDHRKQFVNGLPLDYIYIRGLEVINAKAPMTDASDHNPLMVSLRISAPQEPK